MKNILFITLAIIVGFGSLTLLTAIAQEVIYDGISLTNSPLSTLLVGGGLSVLGAVLSGCVARLVFSPYKMFVPLVISLLIVADTTYIIVNDVTVDPVWFDLLAGGSLIIGVWIGYRYTPNVRRYLRRFTSST